MRSSGIPTMPMVTLLQNPPVRWSSIYEADQVFYDLNKNPARSVECCFVASRPFVVKTKTKTKIPVCWLVPVAAHIMQC